jgi:hypothetical protein
MVLRHLQLTTMNEVFGTSCLMNYSFAIYQLTLGPPGIMSKSLAPGWKAISAFLNRGLSLEVQLRILA